jgi:hypothetical protein
MSRTGDSAASAAAESVLPKVPNVEMAPEVKEHIRVLEMRLVNMITDNCEYRSEYERIAEEGRLLYTTYASKSNQLKQLAALNVKLQGEATAAKDKEIVATKETEKERQEAEKWKSKFKEQLDKHKEVFSSLDKMRQQHEEDVATIKRLTPATGGAKDIHEKKLVQVEKAGVREADLQKKHKQEVQDLETKIAKLKARIDAKFAAPTSAAGTSCKRAENKNEIDCFFFFFFLQINIKTKI